MEEEEEMRAAGMLQWYLQEKISIDE